MRYRDPNYVPPRDPAQGDRRVRSWFSFFGVTIGAETRWWERVIVVQRCSWGLWPHWNNERFIEPEDEQREREMAARLSVSGIEW